MLRILLLCLLALVIVGLAAAGIFYPVLDVTFTASGSTVYSTNIYASGNDSTHVLFLSGDSLKVYTYLVVKRYPTETWQVWSAVDSFGPAPGVYVKSWKGLASANYCYGVKVVSQMVDSTSGRARLQAWETGD